MILKNIIGAGAIAGAIGFSAIGLAGVASAAPAATQSAAAGVHQAQLANWGGVAEQRYLAVLAVVGAGRRACRSGFARGFGGPGFGGAGFADLGWRSRSARGFGGPPCTGGCIELCTG